MELILKSDIKKDKYIEYIFHAYDIQNFDETIVKINNNITLDFDWNIGVIYGGSGTGKTSLLKTFGNLNTIQWDDSKGLISNFDWLRPEEAARLLSSIGLSSVPCWLRPHCTLSNGEQYRANLAYQIAKTDQQEIILVDEFTSVVDRDVAKAMSSSLQKYIRRVNKKVILASCHFDIMDWLNPDWIYSPNKGRVERRDCLRRDRPEIQLEIFRCRYETWKIFKQHHYLTDGLNAAAKCFIILWNDKPVAFMAILPFPHGNIKSGFKISRVVVLPDYQGMGIGSKVCDYFASLYKADGKTIYIKTSNPALWGYFHKSKNWELVSETKSLALNTTDMEKKLIANHTGFRNAITKSYKWVGYKSDKSTDLITFSADAYRNVSQSQQTLF